MSTTTTFSRLATTITSGSSATRNIDWWDREDQRAWTVRGVHQSCQHARRNDIHTSTTSIRTTSPSDNFVGRPCLRGGLSESPASSSYTDDFSTQLAARCSCIEFSFSHFSFRVSFNFFPFSLGTFYSAGSYARLQVTTMDSAMVRGTTFTEYLESDIRHGKRSDTWATFPGKIQN